MIRGRTRYCMVSPTEVMSNRYLYKTGHFAYYFTMMMAFATGKHWSSALRACLHGPFGPFNLLTLIGSRY